LLWLFGLNHCRAICFCNRDHLGDFFRRSKLLFFNLRLFQLKLAIALFAHSDI